MLIPESEIHYSAYSLLDTFGKVFFWNGEVYRGLTELGNEKFKAMRDIGLLSELEKEKLVPTSKSTDLSSKRYRFILKHESITPASFVYEWSFDMIRAAGECIINVNKHALKYGYETSDAHPHNILFKGCVPLFIDLGSFSKIPDNQDHWIGSQEFDAHYHYALNIWNKVSYNMARRIYAEDLTTLTKWEYQNLSLIDTPPYALIIYKIWKRLINKLTKFFEVKKTRAHNLETKLLRLNLLRRGNTITQWGEYHDDYIENDEIIISDRFKYIINKISELQIGFITELAGNWGLLSHLILQSTAVKKIICTDYDEIAVNKMFNFFKSTTYKENLYPVLFDFMLPVDLGRAGKPCERFKSEAVFALAVTHHLILTQNFDIETILTKIAEYTTKYAFIEFMPLGLWNGREAPPIPDWYTIEWFSLSFKTIFDIVEVKEIESNRVLFIGIKK